MVFLLFGASCVVCNLWLTQAHWSTFLLLPSMLCVCLVGGLIDGSSIHNFNGERLTWNPPEFPQGMIIRYEVLVNGTDVFTTTETEIDINSLGLEPGVYTIQVCNVVSIYAYICVCVQIHSHIHMHNIFTQIPDACSHT